MYADYATVSVQELLADDETALDLPWASFVGNRGDGHTFSLPAAAPVDPYLEIQAFDVSEYGHEIVLNGESLSGFDIPPAAGWQYWMDTIPESPLRTGDNTLRFERDATTSDAFAIGSVIVHWRASDDT